MVCTARQISQKLGVSERQVRRAVVEGRLPATKNCYNAYQINLEDANKLFGGVHEALEEAFKILEELGYECEIEWIVNRYGIERR